MFDISLVLMFIKNEVFGGADNYWIVNTCSGGRECISPRKFVKHNGEHLFLFVVTYSSSELYT